MDIDPALIAPPTSDTNPIPSTSTALSSIPSIAATASTTPALPPAVATPTPAIVAPKIRLVTGPKASTSAAPLATNPPKPAISKPLPKKKAPIPPARRPSTRLSTGALRPQPKEGHGATVGSGSGNGSGISHTSAQQKAAAAAKVKLKLKKGGPGQAHYNQLMQGYDRELDEEDESDYDEPLHFDEHFILRMPPGEDAERLREMVRGRLVGKKKKKKDGGGLEAEEVWMKFKDSRRAVFGLGKKSWNAKLVDLPCVIESSKTLDNRHLFKIADISQMLILDDEPILENNPGPEIQETFNIDDYVFPHGITPPMHHVRKRRFKKRVPKRTIEEIERAVEKLLQEDQKADRVEWELVPPNVSDSDEDADATIDPMLNDDGGSVGLSDEKEPSEDEGYDPELAEEIRKAMEELEEDAQPKPTEDGDDDDDDKSLFGSEEEDSEADSEEEDGEGEEGGGEEDEAARKERMRLEMVQEEIRDLEDALARKAEDVGRAANPIIKKRFEDQAKKLASELENKRLQMHTLSESLIRRKEERIELEFVQQQEEEEKAAEAAELERSKSGPSTAGATGGQTSGEKSEGVTSVTSAGANASGGTTGAGGTDRESGKKEDRMDIDPALLTPTQSTTAGSTTRPPLSTLGSSTGGLALPMVAPKSTLSTNGNMRPSTPAGGQGNGPEDVLRRTRVAQIERERAVRFERDREDRMEVDEEVEVGSGGEGEGRETDLKIPEENMAAATPPSAGEAMGSVPGGTGQGTQEEVSNERINEILRDFLIGQGAGQMGLENFF